jgi:photosystem II stability/assembly factor-like uncharacterized protein
MRRILLLLALATTLPSTAQAQWQLQDSRTTADLRGIDNVGKGVAWASGSDGTILRTEDAGFVWQVCAKPPGGEHLDFRAIQAFNNNTAIVMSIGKGDQSRLYKTTDGCQTWKLVFTNPDKDGFFDALHRVASTQLFVAGDPVDGKFAMFTSRDSGDSWFIEDDPGLDAPATAGVFAASNSSLANLGPYLLLGVGGPQAAVYHAVSNCDKTGSCSMGWKSADTSIAHGQPDAGVFSVSARFSMNAVGRMSGIVIAVGGAYKAPDTSANTAAYSVDGGVTWTASTTQPHGFRSAVAYDSKTNTWITIGPNGTDISTDDGRNWRALKPDPKFNDTPDADQHWNALSLPYAVGPHGRIGTLRPSALVFGKKPPLPR